MQKNRIRYRILFWCLHLFIRSGLLSFWVRRLTSWSWTQKSRNAFSHILCSWVRKGIGSSLSRLVRTTASSPLRLTCEPSSPMIAFSHILKVELDLTEMACVSSNVRRTFHVPSGVRVQRSISERSVSYPDFSAPPFPVRFPILSCLMGSMLASYPFLPIVFLGFHFP